MKAYADTSFLLALYRQQTSSPAANMVVRRLTEPLPVTPLVELEVRNGLNLAVFRGEIDAATQHAAWAHFQRDIRDGILVRVTPHSNGLFEKSGELSDAYGPALGTRTLDVLHVAAALLLGVAEFYSFDRRQCALAARCSLVVKPA